MFAKALLFAVALSPTLVAAETLSGDGEPIAFDVGYGIVVNEGSSLLRSWTIINDERLPVSLSNFNGLRTLYQDRNWIFEASFGLGFSSEVAAVEIRFIPFDVWGERSTTLSLTIIKDFSARSYLENGNWRILRESTAVEHAGSIAYVSQVRLMDGTIIHANPEPVLQAAQAFSEDFEIEYLQVTE